MHEVTKSHPSACGDYAYDAIEPTKELLALARSRGFPVIYSTADTRHAGKRGSVRATHRRSPDSGSDPFGIYEAFKPENEDLIIYKERASTFFGTPLSAYLTQNKVDSLIVCVVIPLF